MSETVEFLGAEFRINQRVGVMPMLRYARVAKRALEREKSGGVSDGNDEIEMFDATLSLLESCVHPDDWSRFEDHTTRAGANQDEYMEFAGRVMAELTSRPTEPRSDSSDGPRTIEPNSTVDSSSLDTSNRVIHRLNEQGRPDLALVARRRQEFLTA